MQARSEMVLPNPDALAAAHSARVADHLHERILAAGGAVSFAEFMHGALYAPGLGYYAAGSRKFGAAGDFITAPEISPVFAHVLAEQIARLFADMTDPNILEFGAGSGQLALDILQRLDELKALPAEYRIIEVSADLAARQQQLLAHEDPALLERVTWLDKLPRKHEGAIIANELLDALPVERFRRTKNGITQQCVGSDGQDFVWCERPAGAPLNAAVLAIESAIGRRLPDGYVSEVCLAAPHWLGTVADCLASGMIFLFDYGVSRREYYAAERSGGWLRCHFRHHAHDDPLILPGIQDLTAWVDFTAIAEAAMKSDLRIAGYVTQGEFLLHGGLERELSGLDALPQRARLELSGQVKTLTLPGEMGEYVKCLGLSRGRMPELEAFTAADRTATL